MDPQQGPTLSLERQISEDLLELTMLADETATRPLALVPAMTRQERRELAKFYRLSRALVRQGVVVQLTLAPYLAGALADAA
jgi:hypothetical protein